MSNITRNAGDTISNVTENAGDTVSNVTRNAGDTISNLTENAGDTITNNITEILGAAGDTFGDTVGDTSGYDDRRHDQYDQQLHRQQRLLHRRQRRWRGGGVAIGGFSAVYGGEGDAVGGLGAADQQTWRPLPVDPEASATLQEEIVDTCRYVARRVPKLAAGDQGRYE